jgi:hypothetical protein
MSRGLGQVERRIVELFATTCERSLSVADLANAAYQLNGQRPTREQRLSVTRAAHNILRQQGNGDRDLAKIRVRWRASKARRRLFFHRVRALSIQPDPALQFVSSCIGGEV